MATMLTDFFLRLRPLLFPHANNAFNPGRDIYSQNVTLHTVEPYKN